MIDVRRPSCISLHEAFSPFESALRSPRGPFYVNQPHRANGNQHFAALLFPTGCQREPACIVYKALLLFCINKHLRGADEERSAASARRLQKLGGGGGASPPPCGSHGDERISPKTCFCRSYTRRRSRKQSSERGR